MGRMVCYGGDVILEDVRLSRMWDYEGCGLERMLD